jgi:hypothetical protein
MTSKQSIVLAVEASAENLPALIRSLQAAVDAALTEHAATVTIELFTADEDALEVTRYFARRAKTQQTDHSPAEYTAENSMKDVTLAEVRVGPSQLTSVLAAAGVEVMSVVPWLHAGERLSAGG